MTGRPASTFAVSITPFRDDEALDEDALRAHLRRLASGGVGVYLAGSGSGEGYTLSAAERRRVLEIGAEELAGRAPVRAMGTEPRTAAEMIELGAVVAEVGLDALQVYSLDPGHGNRPTAAELERYYLDVLDRIEVPVVLSSHQSVGYWLPVPLLARLVDRYPQVTGVNCTSPDVTYLQQTIDALGDRVEVHVGGPLHAVTCLALGGDGFLSSDANLAPSLCAAVVSAFDRGDHAACHTAYRTLMRLFAATRACGGVPATKAALGLLGLPGGRPRRPRLPLEGAALDAVQRDMVDALDLARLVGAEA